MDLAPSKLMHYLQSQGLFPAAALSLRSGLDTFGAISQISVLALLIIVAVIRWTTVKTGHHSAGKHQSSSSTSQAKILGEPVPAVFLIALSLAALVVIGVTAIPLSPSEIPGLDSATQQYIYLTRLPVHLLASLLPFHLLLSNTSPLNPLPWLVRTTRTTLLPYHRTLGWAFMILFAIHGSMYMSFYLDKGILLKRVRDSDVQLGMALSSTFSGVAFAGRKKFRMSIGKTWVWMHIAAATTIATLLWFHVKQTRVYVLEAAVVGAVGVGWRVARLVTAGGQGGKRKGEKSN